MFLLLLLVITGVSTAAAEDSSWKVQLHLGHQLKGEGRFADAQKIFAEELRKAEQSGSDTPQVALILANLADVDAALGREWEANGEYERSLAILERHYGPDDDSVLLVVHRLGRLCVQMGRYAKAESFLKRAVDGRRNARLANPKPFAAALRDLGMAYILQRALDKAEPIVRQAVETLDKDPGRHDIQMAGTLNSLAWVMLGTRQFAEGVSYGERSLRLLQAANATAASLADTLTTLGVLYLCVDRLDDASRCLRSAVEYAKVKQWDDRSRLPTALRAYAMVLRRQKRNGEAKSAENRAREILAEAGSAQPTVDISTFLPRRQPR